MSYMMVQDSINAVGTPHYTSAAKYLRVLDAELKEAARMGNDDLVIEITHKMKAILAASAK